jgi:hypothetical protein
VTELDKLVREGRLRGVAGPHPQPDSVGHGVTENDSLVAPPVLQVPDTGYYTRLFPNLQPFVPPMEPLVALGMQGGPMDLGDAQPQLSQTIPAGFTYFGQFLDHNITFQADATFDLGNQPSATIDFRSGRISLEHVYGLGPETQAFEYYDKEINGAFWIDPTAPYDVPRNAQQVAIIPDPRNDNTVITIQIHLAIMKFHNAVVNELTGAGVPAEQVFATAHQLVVWHWQWLVVHEWLPRICDATVLQDIMTNGPKYYRPTGGPLTLPVEFTVAAYRLHPLVLESYRLNKDFAGDLFTGLRQPFAPLDPTQQIDWSYFFDFGDGKVQYAKRFEAKISHGFLDIPGPIDTPLEWPVNVPVEAAMRSIAVRNLLRARAFGLPSGQDVAELMGLTAYTQAELGLDNSLPGREGLSAAPLWYYVMKEAELQTNGATLGSVGSRIVGEVLIGLMSGDPSSYLSVSPGWTPVLSPRHDGTFYMTDLLTIAGVHP